MPVLKNLPWRPISRLGSVRARNCSPMAPLKRNERVPLQAVWLWRARPVDVLPGDQIRRVVLGTMSPGPFGHEHPADRAQAMLWDYDCYGRLPGHIAALDVGAFTEDGDLMSVAQAKEFFLLTQWSEGETYHKDLERLAGAKQPTALDRKRTDASPGTWPRFTARSTRIRSYIVGDCGNCWAMANASWG